MLYGKFNLDDPMINVFSWLYLRGAAGLHVLLPASWGDAHDSGRVWAAMRDA